jgi:death-on-curing protein
MKEPEWILLSSVMAIHAEQLAEHGGREGVLNENGLQSAIASPQNHFHYDTENDIASLAAQYAFSLACNQVFEDGNKRTAAVVCESFLILNGYSLDASEEKSYAMFVRLSVKDIDAEQMAEWIRDRLKPLD